MKQKGQGKSGSADLELWQLPKKPLHNVLLINGTVMLPVYAEDRTYEAEAIEIWQDEGFSVLPLEADLLAPLSGEFHCVAKTLDAP